MIKKSWSDYAKEGKTISDLTEEEKKDLDRYDGIHFLLKDKEILEVINKEFDKKIVREEGTRKAIFICGCGSFVKNLNSTFNVIINGESSSGKSWTTRNVLDIFPDSIFSKETYRTRISQKALTYWHNSQVEPDWNWDGKILYLEDISNDILNSDVFKVMTSEGSTATIVGRRKDKDQELPCTYDIEIKGQPITFVTTAIGTPIDEIKNRFFLIDLDESKEQTDEIIERQLEWAISGEIPKYEPEITRALSQLKRVNVVLPEWIKKIKKFIPRKEILRWRREFPRLLEIIKCSAALHQYQREEDGKGNIIASELDYNIAKQIIGKISSSSGVEGLSHKEKSAFGYIKEYYLEHGRGCTRADIYAFKPTYSDRQWGYILQNLSEKGLLSINLELNEDTKRKANHYYPNEIIDLSLPDFINLDGSNGTNGDENVNSDFKRIVKKALNEGYTITSITSTSFAIFEKGEPKQVSLEIGGNYDKSFFGEQAEDIIWILFENGDIKLEKEGEKSFTHLELQQEGEKKEQK